MAQTFPATTERIPRPQMFIFYASIKRQTLPTLPDRLVHSSSHSVRWRPLLDLLQSMLVNSSHLASDPCYHFWMDGTHMFSFFSNLGLDPDPKKVLGWVRKQFFFWCPMVPTNLLIDLYPHPDLQLKCFLSWLSWCDPATLSWQWNLFHTCHTRRAVCAF